MSETVLPGRDAVLEVVSPDGARRNVRVTQSPFLIGRGAETGNHRPLVQNRGQPPVEVRLGLENANTGRKSQVENLARS